MERLQTREDVYLRIPKPKTIYIDVLIERQSGSPKASMSDPDERI